MAMKIYLLAQGQGSRCSVDPIRHPNSPELPSKYKQLIPMGYVEQPDGSCDTEYLITRTIRQVGGELSVVADGDFFPYMPEGIDFRTFREPTGCILEGISRTKDEWYEHSVIFLLGDVIYSNRAMRRILRSTDEIAFFGRFGSNKKTGKLAPEIFALSICSDELVQHSVWKWMRRIWFHDANVNAKLWTLYDFIADPEEILQTGATVKFHVIDDYTDDIDSPEEYQRFFDILKESAIEDDKR